MASCLGAAAALALLQDRMSHWTHWTGSLGPDGPCGFISLGSPVPSIRNLEKLCKNILAWQSCQDNSEHY